MQNGILYPFVHGNEIGKTLTIITALVGLTAVNALAGDVAIKKQLVDYC